jgi:uncharacterized protein YqeY
VSERGGTLKDRLAAELYSSMKARDKVRLSAVRMLTASVKNREVELGHPLTDEEFVEVATREVKRRREAIEAYEKAGREDRAEVEREEQQVLEAYIPAGLSEQEITALIDEAVVATGATGPGDMGKVMSTVMAKARGRADGRQVQAAVRARLGG